jgi:hypothetical protein
MAPMERYGGDALTEFKDGQKQKRRVKKRTYLINNMII